MSIALVSLSAEGLNVARRLAPYFCDVEIHVHDSVEGATESHRFSKVADLTRGLFGRCKGIVYIMPSGVAVRAIVPLVEHKLRDPAVVVVDVLGRWAVSLLCGHEGGANALTLQIANLLEAEPVITTTSEAAKNLIVGIGCRRGTPADTIVAAITEGLVLRGHRPDEVRYLASADLKADEAGLLEAAERLDIPLRLISGAEIRASGRMFHSSAFVQDKVALPAVAEPAALLAGRRTQLILPKTIIKNVTVAIARENCSWSASDPATDSTGPAVPSKP
ncbi:cobalt-precorrin-5A hydrolase [Syntrophotalea carbinolica DSM 2380]|uniref:Cobalt-precorrin-5A hydrolase n=1 Tax=Syntrophotalea carbinolica (strain DSM 2380 / NBRC 103641 / GraBd1) TaxID=338963 RepID=Q3A7B2_SYNC1|nr:cobalamin biosynthesis protein [Syntrophotalea carbinolica]ABA87732.1 cobalt-precorrin-5A hydrolase [Syntrophotalea carbinolica DSM 2380]